MATGVVSNDDITRYLRENRVGKDEVAGSNPAISSMNLEHVVSMGPGFFLLPVQAVSARNIKTRHAGYSGRNVHIVTQKREKY